MTIRTVDNVIRLEGVCPVDDAEPLLSALIELETPAVDVSKLERAHTAVVQVLAAMRPEIIGEPDQGLIRDLLLPALAEPR